MKYKHIQAAHEIRMWCLTIGTAVAFGAKYLERHPEIAERAHEKFDNLKGKFTKNKHEEKTIKITIIRED